MSLSRAKTGILAAFVGCALAPLAAVRGPLPPAQASPGGRAARAAEHELRTGIALTRAGRFAAAIPHLTAARGHVADEFAAAFDLALCDIAVGQSNPAIRLLEPWRSGPHATQVLDLLAQAYIGAGQSQAGFATLEAAAARAPGDEMLYLFAADACLGRHDAALGLRVVALGLARLPRSARLEYDRGVFLTWANRGAAAAAAFVQVQTLAPGTAWAALAAAQGALLAGEPAAAVAAARAGLELEPANYLLLTILGQATLQSGAAPGQPAFAAARAALLRAVALHPDYPAAQLELGRLELAAGQAAAALPHLLAAARASGRDAAVFAALAAAYRGLHERAKAEAVLAELARLNAAQSAAYRAAGAGPRASYRGAAAGGPR